MIEKEFVSYEIASQLKEIEFDEECLAGWEKFWNGFQIHIPSGHHSSVSKIPFYKKYSASNEHIIKAPLYQQVISWFLERKIWINIFAIDNWNSWTFDIVMEDIMQPFYVQFDEKELGFSSYEEAREAAILKAIEEYKNLNIK